MDITPQATLEISPRAAETVYRLPPAPAGSRRYRHGRIELQIGVLLLLAMAGLIGYGLAAGWGPGALIIWGVIPGAIAPLLLLDGYGKRYGRPTVRADRNRLRFWEALLARCSARDRPLPAVARFVVHPLAEEPGSPTPPPDDLGVLEVVGNEAPPYWFADGYPLPMLHDLADCLARHCYRHRQDSLLVEDGPPVSAGKLAALQGESVRDDEVADVNERPPATRWEVTRSPGEVTLVQPPCRQEGLWLILVVVICGVLSMWLLSTGLPEPRVQGKVVFGTSLLLTSIGAAVYGLHAGTRERRVTVRDGQLNWSEWSRVVPRLQPRRWSAGEVQALRTSYHSGKGGTYWTLRLFTRDGLGHDLYFYFSPEGDEVRWLATELRAALGVPAVPRPEVDGPTERTP